MQFLKGSQIFIKYHVKCESNNIFHDTLALVYVLFSLNGFCKRVYIVATPFLPAILYTEKLTAKLEIVRQFPVLLVLLLKCLLFNWMLHLLSSHYLLWEKLIVEQIKIYGFIILDWDECVIKLNKPTVLFGSPVECLYLGILLDFLSCQIPHSRDRRGIFFICSPPLL